MERSLKQVLVATLSGLTLLAGCSKHPASEAAATKTEPVESDEPLPPPDPAQEARKLFNTKCITCHGDHGAGDGPNSVTLDPKPRAFADAKWQDSVSDEQIKKTIRRRRPCRGQERGHVSEPRAAEQARRAQRAGQDCARLQTLSCPQHSSPNTHGL
jgi:mono/diheme cytochrome c family protein